MSHKFGFPAMTNRAMGNKSSGNGPSSTETNFLIRVESINLQPSDGDFSLIGVVTGRKVDTITGLPTGKIIYNIYPSSSNFKIFPVVGEYVEIWKVIAPNTFNGRWVWGNPTNLGMGPNSNIYPLEYNNTTPPSQNLNYEQIESGAVNIASSNPSPVSNISSFEENSNIHPLLPFMGDIIYEGRWGNSIRFGSTSLSTPSSISNNWSSTGDIGSPITIIKNGQPSKTSNLGVEPIVENINKDLSSIYLTSTQKIPFSLSREEFYKWKTPPKTPSSFVNPQVIVNSDRVIINSKNDSILISAKQSIGLSCNDEINFIGNNIVVDAQNIYLGSKNATEPILLGNKTVDALSRMLTQLIGICDLLSVSKIYPRGVPISDAPMNAMASNASSALQDIQNQLNSLKSNISKTK
jgi:hypothetical protein